MNTQCDQMLLNIGLKEEVQTIQNLLEKWKCGNMFI